MAMRHGLAFLSAIMAWPSFHMGQTIHPQMLKLEKAFNVQDEIKVAAILRWISGRLRAHFSLQLDEGMGYAGLRECLMKWDRAQQKWGHLIWRTRCSTDGD